MAIPAPMRLTDNTDVDIEVQHAAGGGFGRVFMGPDRVDSRIWFALKTLRPEVLARSPRARDLFIREALTWCGLWPHANLLLAATVTEINAQPFLVLEYAEHGSLRDLLRQPERVRWAGQRVQPGRLPLGTALRWAQHIAAGLLVLHTPDPAWLRPEPLVHRDLKPENVLLNMHGYAQITDFGLAKAVQTDAAALALLDAVPSTAGPAVAAAAGAARMAAQMAAERATRSQALHTAAGLALGTPAYMAPEQWQDAASAGPPADLYAFGLILSELFAGRHALLDLDGGYDVAAWRGAHQQPTPRPLRAVVAEMPASVEALYQALVARQPEGRPTAGEALLALQQAAEALGEVPYRVPEVYAHTPEHERLRWHSWAIAYARFKLYPEALARNERALALAPHDPNVLCTRGAILARQGQVEAALAASDAALAVLPTADRFGRLAVWDQRGILLSDSRRYAEAEAAYVEALALQPEAADVWYNRARNEGRWGQSEAQAGRMGEARGHAARGLQHVTHAIALNPNDPDYRGVQAALRELLARPGG